MRYLPRPTDDSNQAYDARIVFDTCVAMVQNNELRKRLQGVASKIGDKAKDYVLLAEDGKLYKMEKLDGISGLSAKELIDVYLLRMVPKKSKGRPIYNRIMSIPLNGRCPMCGIGTVNTLDHYLPKEHFPIFAVTPLNLVPACKWCQGEKFRFHAETEDEQLMHPYFDDYRNERWLSAKVVQGTPAGFRFFVEPPANWTNIQKTRAETHLQKLKLTTLFSSNAGSRLSEIRTRLTTLFTKGGKRAVREHLDEELLSFEAEELNSWTSAMYRAAVADEWFCDNGFSGI